jgi:hypothetical protein
VVKNLIGLIAVTLTFVGYIPYLRDVLKGKTRPHVYSWFLWGFMTLIAFALQVSAKGGAGSFVTLAAALISLVIFALGMRQGKKDITKLDTVFFILGLIAVVFWLVAKQPVFSIILVVTVDMLGFAPTFRKSWYKPYSETLFTYLLNTFRHSLSIFALKHYSIVTWLYPVSWAVANGLFSLMLVVRRKQVKMS